MATTTTRPGAAATPPPRPPLPTIKVAKFRELGALLERLVDTNTDVFVAAGQRYRERHLAGTERPLQPLEIAQIAACMSLTLADAKTQITELGLTAHDEPDPTQLLLIMGIQTAPAWMTSVLALVALIEMPDTRFQAARETGTLQEELDADTTLLENLDLADAHARARAAMDHVAAQSGADPGKAWSVLGRSVLQALQQAAEQLRTTPATSSLTSSPTSTDGTAP